MRMDNNLQTEQVFKQQILFYIEFQKKIVLFLFILAAIVLIVTPITSFVTPIVFLMFLVLIISYAMLTKDGGRLKNGK